MKIGTFARKFNLNISAIRYYVNNGLLSPSRIGGQYEFNKDCISDMEKIMKYKKYNFSLEEIQLLFFMEKASHLQDELIIEVCSDILKNKRKELISKRDNLTQFIDEIEKEIENMPAFPVSDPSDDGIPFSIIPYLYCPVCQEPLSLDSASLSNGRIQKGVLSCECGYKGTISDGIILCTDYMDDTPFKAFENVESVMAMKDQFSSTYRKLITKAYIWMYHQIENQLNEVKYILAGPFTLNFLLEYIEKIGKQNIFIVFDPSLKRINKLKKYLAHWNFNIVYIVGKPNELPIKNGSIDMYIDDYSTVNSLFKYNSFSTEHISPLLKNAGDIVGIFTTYQNAPNSLHNFKKDHSDFKPEKMTLGGLKSQWSFNGVKSFDERKIGATTANELHFPQNAKGETVEVHGYHAKKG